MPRMTFGPDDEQAFYARRDQLVDDFRSWVSALPVHVDPTDVGMLLDWKWSYSDGDLGRWTRGDIEEFLVEWCPHKVSAPAELMSGLPSTVALAMSFLAERRLHSGSEPVEQLTDHAVGLQAEFLAAMDDPSKHGMAKSIFSTLGIDDPTALDADGLQRAMDEFNNLSFEERDAALAGTMEAPPQPPIGPVVLPSDDAARESAESSVVLDRFEKLSTYLADPGKTLTQRGNLKIADARALVDLLDTGDEYETEIGDQTFRKGSSTEFVGVDHWQWWARESGVIRKRGNRLVAVKAWRQRVRKDPIDEVLKAFNVIAEYGPLASWTPGFYGDIDALVDASLPLILGKVVSSAGPVEFDEIVEVLERSLEQFGLELSYPGMMNTLVDRMFELVERAGVIVQDGAERVPDKYGLERRSGGRIRPTPVGVLATVELLKASDIPVDIVSNPADLSAASLAELALDAADPPRWWATVSAWLDGQPDRASALQVVVGELAAASPVLVVLALDAAPESEDATVEAVARVLMSESPSAPGHLAAIGLGWLIQREKADFADIDRDTALDAILTPLGLIAELDNSAVAEQLLGAQESQMQLEVIDAIVRRQPPGAVELLEAVGRDHPDKTIAKTARKELYRLRSRLAGTA